MFPANFCHDDWKLTDESDEEDDTDDYDKEVHYAYNKSSWSWRRKNCAAKKRAARAKRTLKAKKTPKVKKSIQGNKLTLRTKGLSNKENKDTSTGEDVELLESPNSAYYANTDVESDIESMISDEENTTIEALESEKDNKPRYH